MWVHTWKLVAWVIVSAIGSDLWEHWYGSKQESENEKATEQTEENPNMNPESPFQS